MSDMTADQLADDLDKQAKRQTRKGGTIEKLTKDYVVRTAVYTAINIPPQEEQITLLETDIRWDISMRYISIRQYGASLLKTAQTKTERTFAAALVRGRYDEKLREKAEASTGFRYLRPVSLSSAEIDKVEDGENITRQLIGIVREGDIAGQLRRIGDLVGMMDSIRDGKKADSRTFSILRDMLAEAAGTSEHAELLQAVADTPPVVAIEVNGRTVLASAAMPEAEFERLMRTPA